jgi:hypothetical protein
VSAVARLRERFAGGPGARPLLALAASGQLGYGIPEPALKAGLERKPDFIGCDMGSIDPGPYYLGSGQIATSEVVTRRDLGLVLRGARALDVPLLIGSAGCAGARPHLEQTLTLLRGLAREEGLRFRLAVIGADIPKDAVKAARTEGRLTPIGEIPEPDDGEIESTTNLVGQMGTEAFRRALDMEADVILAGRACDTAIFAAIPEWLGFPLGPATHMAKIIECTSLCCTPGGRDAMLGTLEGDSFVIESMNPARRATPMSVAAHALYEQADPYMVQEPEGALHLDTVRYEPVDERRVRVLGARWETAARPSVKIEGAKPVGMRGIVVAGAADPHFIASVDDITAAVESNVREMLTGTVDPNYQIFFRVYGRDGVVAWPEPPATPPREIFVMVECIAPTAEHVKTVLACCKQYLLHHGFPGRISTAGNIAFPFTPPEILTGPAYQFSLYHIMQVDALAPLFPITMETI